LDNFSPRLGIAYSPEFVSGFLAKLTGGPAEKPASVQARAVFSPPSRV
jgi:hypothetical protein